MKPFKKSFTKNEGELKKRLNYHADNNDYFMVDIEIIEEILDEAKQEYEKLCEHHYGADGKAYRITLPEPHACYEWFLKWFGTIEKETT